MQTSGLHCSFIEGNHKMKTNRLFLWAVLAHLAQLSICFLYSGGAPLLLMLFVPLHLMLFMMNNHVAKTWLHVISLGGLHLVLSICTCQLYGWLYLHKICYDIVGAAISLGVTILAAGLVSILWILSIALFYFRNRKKAKVD